MRIVFNLMNHFNPISGGLNVIINAMYHLKEHNFNVCIYYYSYEEQKSIHLGLEKDFQILSVDELNPATDVVVVAEEFVWVANDVLVPKKIKYVLFNQGIFASLYSYNSFNVHKLIYQNALYVLVNSLHTAKGVEKIFEVPKEKIYLHRIGIDTNLYYPESKEKIACCLAYKNGGIVRFIEHYFRDTYPDWQFMVIHNLPKAEAAAIFRKSKLFLSFGGPEGFGLPPLEAAFSGCKVIGFHGEAGKEYFKEPTFTSVNFMDHIDYVEKLKIVIESIDDSRINEYNEYVDYLRYFYSIGFAKESIINFFAKIQNENFT